MYSEDGEAWTAVSAVENNRWRSVTFGNGRFVTVSSGGTNQVMYSEDPSPEIVSITSELGSAEFTNQQTFTMDIEFTEEIANFDISGLNIENATATVFTTDDDISFEVTIEADDVTTSSNTVSVKVAEAAFEDLAENPLDNSDNTTYEVEFGDTRPTAALSSSELNPTGANQFEVALNITEIFGEPVSTLTQADFTLSGAQITNIDDTNNPEFILTVEPEEEGEIRIQLNENVLADVAGNENKASNEFTRTYDITSPSAAFSADVSDPFYEGQFTLTITFNKEVTDFDLTDINSENATLDQFTDIRSDLEYSVVVTPIGDGEVTVEIPAGVIEDLAQNENIESVFTITYDPSPPQVVVTSPDDEVVDIDPQPLLEWEAADRAGSYELQLSGNDEFDTADLLTSALGHPVKS